MHLNWTHWSSGHTEIENGEDVLLCHWTLSLGFGKDFTIQYISRYMEHDMIQSSRKQTLWYIAVSIFEHGPSIMTFFSNRRQIILIFTPKLTAAIRLKWCFWPIKINQIILESKQMFEPNLMKLPQAVSDILHSGECDGCTEQHSYCQCRNINNVVDVPSSFW